MAALRLIAAAPCILLAACNIVPTPETVKAVQTAPAKQQATTAQPAPVPPSTPAQNVRTGPDRFIFNGELTQGGWIRGQVPGGTVSARLDDQELSLDNRGVFFAAFDRDAGQSATLMARLSNGRTLESPLTINPRAWDIERVNLARSTGGASEAFMRRRLPELAQINAARGVNANSDGWSQSFIWPVKGRISGRFGSQRIYAGVPGSYHSGIDIATGENGTPYVAPADGVVVLATQTPFSLEGYLLIIDHGMGLNSAFLHNSRLVVREGDVVKKGQYIGNIGSTGSATGPHLHWSLKWRDTRLDPLLFTGPM